MLSVSFAFFPLNEKECYTRNDTALIDFLFVVQSDLLHTFNCFIMKLQIVLIQLFQGLGKLYMLQTEIFYIFKCYSLNV